jgi:hypothetical protein
VSFYVSTAIYVLLHCDEWDRFVAPPRDKFVTGAILLQLGPPSRSMTYSLLFWPKVYIFHTVVGRFFNEF